jgi:outer membrane protein assembly factor BamD
MRINLKKYHYLILAGLASAAILACSRAVVKQPPTPYGQYQSGMQHYQKGDYLKAQSELQKVIYSFPGLAFIDTAQYYMAMSYFNIGRYPEAIGEFKRFLQTYPTSPLADRAQYRIAQAYFKQSPSFSHDQIDTYSAIDEFSVFLDKYPDSPLIDSARTDLNVLYDKLAEKLFKSGLLYIKLGRYDAALVYFAQVRDNYADTPWAANALYYSGEAEMKLGKNNDALHTFQDFVIAFPDHKLVKKAREYIGRLTPQEAGG